MIATRVSCANDACFGPLGDVFLGKLTLQHQQTEGQQQRQRRTDTGRQSQCGGRQSQVPDLFDAQQRQQRPTPKPQRRSADLRQQFAAIAG